MEDNNNEMSVPHGGHPSNVPAGGGIPLAVGTGSVVPNNMTLLAQLREKYEDLPGELVRRILEQVWVVKGCRHKLFHFFALITLMMVALSGYML